MENTTLKTYLRYTDGKEYLTYGDYLKNCVKHNQEPIKLEQWECLVSTLGNRKMIYESSVKQAFENLKEFNKDLYNQKK